MRIVFDLPSIVVDINVFRVISRMYLFEWAAKPDFNAKCQVQRIKEFLESFLPQDFEIHQIVHTMILLQGKHVSMSKPKCHLCRVKEYCKYRRTLNE